MSDFFTVSVIIATLASAVRFATPFLLAALGETIGQRAGVLNLGVEGVMLLGAFAAYYTRLRADEWGLPSGTLTAVIAALLVGLAMGAIYATLTIVFHAEPGHQRHRHLPVRSWFYRLAVPEAGRDATAGAGSEPPTDSRAQ